MIAKDLISDIIPTVSTSDTRKDVLNSMAIFKVSHLPVINNQEFLGLISESDIYSKGDANKQIEYYTSLLSRIFIHDYQHSYDAIASMSKHKLSLLPVIDSKNCYIGSITALNLVNHYSTFTGAEEPGAIIVLQVNHNDYVLTEIAQIVESNDSKILSLYVVNQDNKTKLNITIKLNTKNLSSIIKTFERYNYNVKSSYEGDQMSEQFYNERMSGLISYLNV